MTNRYLNKLQETGLEKQALDPFSSFALHAGLVHVGQNALTRQAIRNRHFGENVAEHFHAGMHGKVAPSSLPRQGNLWQRTKQVLGKEDMFNIQTLAGGINPELNILRDEAYHAGHTFRKELAKHGYTPDSLPEEAKSALEHVAKGNFTHVKQRYLDDPIAQKVIRSFSNATGHPIPEILSGTEKGLQLAEKAWRDNPLSSNIITRMGTRRDMSHLPDGHSAPSTQKSLAGTAIASAALTDPALAFMNSMKVGLADPRVTARIPKIKPVTDRLNDFFVASSLREAAKKGLEGKEINQPYNNLKKVFGSHLVSQAGSLTNQLALAAHAGGYKNVISEGEAALGTVNKIQEKAMPVINRIIEKSSLGNGAKATPQTTPQPPKKPNRFLDRLAIGGAIGGGGVAGAGGAYAMDRNSAPAF